MGIVVQAGDINTQAILAPNAVIQILPPSVTAINGVASNISGYVGVASWGPVGQATDFGTLNEAASYWGLPLARSYDMMTAIYAATLNNAVNMIGVRVTDGTDTAASASILDTSAEVGMTVTGKYTGIVGNNIQVTVGEGSAPNTKKVTVTLPNVTAEFFNNIPGTGAALWQNIANAINLGQTGQRGPSQYVTAATANFVSSVTVGNAGSYATMPTPSTTGNGTGATFGLTMKLIGATPAAAGTGYIPTEVITYTGGVHTINAKVTVATTKLVSIAVNAGGTNYLVNDKIVLAGGTFGTAVILNVDAVTAGVITAVSIDNAGSYTANTATFTQSSTTGVGTGATFNTAVWGVNTVTVNTIGAYTTLPSSPVAQGSTTGSGTGATFTSLWGLLSVQVTAGGEDYNLSSGFLLTGGGSTGGGQGTLVIGSADAPEDDTYTLAGGTDGDQHISTADMLGVDVSPRTGMYALRGQGVSMAALIDLTDPNSYSIQEAFGLSEGIYMMLLGPASQTIAEAKTAKEGAGLIGYDTKYLVGDWCYIFDTFNGVTRMISPQGFVLGRLSNLAANMSGLNQQIVGIVGTQGTMSGPGYTNADIVALCNAGLDLIYNPSPGGDYFALQSGQNVSPAVLTRMESYTRLTNYMAYSIANAVGIYVGQLQNPTVRQSAYATLMGFFMNLFNAGMIGDVNFPNDATKAFKITLDATNNPSLSVQEGYMIADIQIVDYAVIRVFLVNLQNGQVSLQSITPV